MPTPPTVVVVDDDASVRAAIARQLRAAGFRTETRASALELLGSGFQGGPDVCLVVDVVMPEMQGPELLRALRATGRAAPAVLITAREELAVTPEAGVEVLRKPLGIDALVDAIGRALQRWRSG